MSDERNGGGKKIEGFKNLLKSCCDEAKDQIQKVEEKKKLETERHRKIKDNYDDWIKKQRPEAEKAAQTIIEWVNQFLVSDIWRELVSSLGSLKTGSNRELLVGYLDISRNIIYEGPSSNPYHPYGNQGYQSFLLDLSGNLLIANNVKYGKSHKLRNLADMMRYVDPVVLIKVAETIQNDSIWTIIQEEFQQRLKRCMKHGLDVD